MNIVHATADYGDSYWAIAQRLAPDLEGDEFTKFFNHIGNLNGWVDLYPGQVIHLDEDILPGKESEPIQKLGNGWGEWKGLTGGHIPVEVTTEADSGPGSFREAVTVPDAYITFADNVKKIILNSDVVSDHNVTVDGKRNVEISHSATKFEGRNVIVRGILFRDNTRTDNTDCLTFRTKPGEKDIQVFGVYDCLFDRATDAGCDIIWNQGVAVYGTLARNTFKNINKACLIDSGDDAYEGGRYHVTFHNNKWIDCYQRMPMARYCDLHCYDETLIDYGDAAGHGGGIKSAVGSNLLAERIISQPRVKGATTFDGTIVTRPRMEAVGPQLSSETGNVKTVDCNPDHVKERNPSQVSLPPYHSSIA